MSQSQNENLITIPGQPTLENPFLDAFALAIQFQTECEKHTGLAILELDCTFDSALIDEMDDFVCGLNEALDDDDEDEICVDYDKYKIVGISQNLECVKELLEMDCDDITLDQLSELGTLLDEHGEVGLLYLDEIQSVTDAWDAQKGFEEAYAGTWDSDEEFAENEAEQIGAVDRNAGWPNNYIDWEKAAEALMHDYFTIETSDGETHYFRNM